MLSFQSKGVDVKGTEEALRQLEIENRTMKKEMEMIQNNYDRSQDTKLDIDKRNESLKREIDIL